MVSPSSFSLRDRLPPMSHRPFSLLFALFAACAPDRTPPAGDDDDAVTVGGESNAWTIEIHQYADGYEDRFARFYRTNEDDFCGVIQELQPGVTVAEDIAEQENQANSERLEQGEITEEEFSLLLCESAVTMYETILASGGDVLDDGFEMLDFYVSPTTGDEPPAPGDYSFEGRPDEPPPPVETTPRGAIGSFGGSFTRFLDNPYQQLIDRLDCTDPNWQDVFNEDVFGEAVEGGNLEGGPLSVRDAVGDTIPVALEDGLVVIEGGELMELSFDEDFPRCEVVIVHGADGGVTPPDVEPTPE